MTMKKNVWQRRCQTMTFVCALVIGIHLPSVVRSMSDCGLSSMNINRRSNGRSSHAFLSSSSSFSSSSSGLRGNPQVVLLSNIERPSSEKLRINNLLGGGGNRTEAILNHYRATTTGGGGGVGRRGGRIQRQPEASTRPTTPTRRKARIIMGRETNEGEFPWQASLQLLHPVLGFIGHWCGGVLIHQNWILSAAHCVHNDLFNLAMPEAWSVVLGDYDRHIESGYEQRIAVDRIVMHDNYENYQHDVVLMRLSRPANTQRETLARKICLPFVSTSSSSGSSAETTIDDIESFDGSSNQLRKLQLQPQRRRNGQSRRRNDKFVKERSVVNRVDDQQHRHWSTDRKKYVSNANQEFHFPNIDRRTQQQQQQQQQSQQFLKSKGDLPYQDCIATGWGMMTVNGELTDILLQSKVPLLSNHQCQRAYRGYVKIHSGHLCGGKVDGEGGTCVGDSGGPLQCRISKNGPWILAGITSFGWNCSENVPDVFTRISYYVNWITDTINER